MGLEWGNQHTKRYIYDIETFFSRNRKVKNTGNYMYVLTMRSSAFSFPLLPTCDNLNHADM